MKVIGVIPARWASVRFNGKVLADINGKPMIQHVWERAKQSSLLDDVYIACDDDRVFDAAQDFGARAVMTSVDHPSGTDRIAEACQHSDADVIVNIQGDEPLIDPGVIDSLVKVMIDDASCSMATVIKRITDKADISNPNVVKVVIDQKGWALYFSRAVIPFDRENKDFESVTYFKHLGLYAYKKDFLSTLTALPESCLERIEKLEQLRVLEAGYKIKTVETTNDSVSVDTEEDLNHVVALLDKGD